MQCKKQCLSGNLATLSKQGRLIRLNLLEKKTKKKKKKLNFPLHTHEPKDMHIKLFWTHLTCKGTTKTMSNPLLRPYYSNASSYSMVSGYFFRKWVLGAQDGWKSQLLNNWMMDVAYNSSVWQSSNTSHPLTINVMSNTLPCVFTFLCRKVGQQTGEPWDSCLLYSATQVLVTLCCLCPLAQLLHHSTGRGWVVRMGSECCYCLPPVSVLAGWFWHTL